VTGGTPTSPDSLEGRRIPEFSREHPLCGTTLWDAIFPEDEAPAPESGVRSDERSAPDEVSAGVQNQSIHLPSEA
jgi:hypothetical protein